MEIVPTDSIQNRIRSFFKGSVLFSYTSTRILSGLSGFLKDWVIIRLFGLGVFLDTYYALVTLVALFMDASLNFGYGVLLPLSERHESSPGSPSGLVLQPLLIALWNRLFLLMLVVIAGFLFLKDGFGLLLFPKLYLQPESYFTPFWVLGFCVSSVFASSYAWNVMMLKFNPLALFPLPRLLGSLFTTAFIFLTYGFWGKWSLIVGVTLSFAVEALTILVLSRVRWRPYWHVDNMPNFFVKSLPTCFISSSIIIFAIIDNFYFARLPAGSLTSYRYAAKILTSCSELTVISLSMTYVMDIMKLGTNESFQAFKQLLYQKYRDIFKLGMLLAVLSYFVAPFLVLIFINTHHEKAENIAQLTLAIRILMFQLPYAGCWVVLCRFYNTLLMARGFLIIQLGFIPLRCLFLQIGYQHWQFEGLLVGSTLHVYLMLLVGTLYLLMRRRKMPSISPANL